MVILHYLILCLYHNDKCISSITLKNKDKSTIEIDSRTNDKYNTLLRAIVVMISSYIICNGEQIKKIYSIAANPISAS